MEIALFSRELQTKDREPNMQIGLNTDSRVSDSNIRND